MKRFLVWFFVFIATVANAQTMGGSSGPVIWSGSVGQVLPSSGIYLPDSRKVRLGEAAANGSNYVSLEVPASLATDYNFIFPGSNGTSGNVLTNGGSGAASWGQANLASSNAVTGVLPLANGGTNKNMTPVTGGVAYSDTDSLELTAAGTSVQVLHGGSAPTWGSVNLATDTSGTLDMADGGSSKNLAPVAGGLVYTDADSMEVLAPGTTGQYLKSNGTSAPSWGAIDISTASITGVLPLANGGTNKNMTAVAGGIVWTDANSQEVTSAGTASDWVLSGGTGTPTMSSITTTPKMVDGSSDQEQLVVQGNGTQTSNIFVVENSVGTDLLAVTSANGTKITGTTTNDNAATGKVGEYVENFRSTNSPNLTSGQYCSIDSSLTPACNSGNESGITLTAGDWDLSGQIFFNGGSGTTVSELRACIGTATGNSSTGCDEVLNQSRLLFAPSSTPRFTVIVPTWRVSISATTTYYLKGYAAFATNNLNATGILRARRMR